MRSRFAPTPSGYLHLGNVFNLLLIERWREQTGGKVLLRIDDLDRPRFRSEYLKDVFAVSEWLDVRYDEGPRSPEDFLQHWSQTRRAGRYLEALAPAREAGLLFACSCSRAEVRGQSADGSYRGTCRDRRLPLESSGVAWRIRLESRDVPGPPDPGFADPVVRRKDGSVAYHVASVVDDLDYRITDIIRGVDLEPSSQLQRVLAAKLGLDAFQHIRIRHHELLIGPSGTKLSKSAGRESASLLQGTLSARQVRSRFASWLLQTASPLSGPA